MSPEQARASPELDERCDLWALATVAYEALTGELPVPGASTDELLMNLCAGVVRVHEREPQLPGPLSGFFERAFAPRIEDRFATASELAEALERAASEAAPRDGDTTSSRSNGGPADTALSATRGPLQGAAAARSRVPKSVVWAATGMAILGVGAAGVALHASNRSAHPMIAGEGVSGPPVGAAALSPTDMPAVRLEPADKDAQAAAEDAQGAPPERATASHLPAKPLPATRVEPRAPASATPVAPRPASSPVSPNAQKRLDKSEVL
jgi:serine/threonine-protein kinase